MAAPHTHHHKTLRLPLPHRLPLPRRLFMRVTLPQLVPSGRVRIGWPQLMVAMVRRVQSYLISLCLASSQRRVSVNVLTVSMARRRPDRYLLVAVWTCCLHPNCKEAYPPIQHLARPRGPTRLEVRGTLPLHRRPIHRRLRALARLVASIARCN